MLINRTVIYSQLMALILSILLAIPTVYAIKRAVISGLEILNITIRDEHRHDVHVAFENVPLITVVIIYILCNVLLYLRNKKKLESKADRNK